MQLTVLTVTLNEASVLPRLLGRVRAVLADLGVTYELVVIDGGSTDGSLALARQLGAVARQQTAPGFGCAVREGFQMARGAYVLTLDADGSHDPEVIPRLWAVRQRAELVVASRYVAGGTAEMPRSRYWMSRAVNTLFARGLGVPIRDLSSGFRLYRRDAVCQLSCVSGGFELQLELAVRAHRAGWRIVEIPFRYRPRAGGRSKARPFRWAWAYARCFWQLQRVPGARGPAAVGPTVCRAEPTR